MRVAIVSQPGNYLLPSEVSPRNSIVIWTRQVARRLAAYADCEVIVYTPTRHFTLRPKIEYEDGVTYYGVPLTTLDARLAVVVGKLGRRFGTHPSRPFIASIWYYLLYILLVTFDVRRRGCDVVHVLNYSQFVRVIRWLNPQVKILLNMRCEWLSQFDAGLMAPRVAAADRVIGCSHFVSQQAAHRFSMYSAKMGTVWNGTDPDQFRCPPRGERPPRRLLYVGRVSPEKGIHVLIEAFSRVFAAHPEIELEIVGPPGNLPRSALFVSDDPKVIALERFYRLHGGPVGSGYRHDLDRLLSDEAASHVHYTGPLNHDELVEHYCAADIFVFPSIWQEPFGIPPVEAMAAGLPVISTRGGGPSEIVQHCETGLLVERGSVEELVGAMLTLLEDAELYHRMQINAVQRAREHFSWDHVAQNFYREYGVLYDQQHA